MIHILRNKIRCPRNEGETVLELLKSHGMKASGPLDVNGIPTLVDIVGSWEKKCVKLKGILEDAGFSITV